MSDCQTAPARTRQLFLANGMGSVRSVPVCPAILLGALHAALPRQVAPVGDTYAVHGRDFLPAMAVPPGTPFRAGSAGDGPGRAA